MTAITDTGTKTKSETVTNNNADNEMKPETNNLNQLLNLCNETESQLNVIQDDSGLIEYLENNYSKLSKAKVKNIIELVEGKNDSTNKSLTKTKIKNLENKLIGQCYINNIIPIIKGEFMGYKKLKNKISKIKSSLNKKTIKGGK